MYEYFYTLADAITAQLKGDEIYTCTFRGEDSDFVRFNRSAVRQAGTVAQRFLNLDLIRGQRHAAADVALSGDLEEDRTRLTQAVAELREHLPYLPEDPYLLYATEVQSSVHEGENTLPDSASAVAAVLDAGHGRDLVGFYAAGGIYAGFANAFGQRNWFASYSFNCDWSFYYQADKAVKTAYAGFVWGSLMSLPTRSPPLQNSSSSCGKHRELFLLDTTESTSPLLLSMTSSTPSPGAVLASKIIAPNRPRCSRWWKKGRACIQRSHSVRTHAMG
jgi:hypothetical protein